MKNKKGFTLIELLAVIVILAIIALIATPIILNMIENAKKGAAKDSAYGYIEAIEKNNALANMNENYTKIEDGTNINIKKIHIKLKGKLPKDGIITLEKGIVKNAYLCINEYYVSYNGKTATITESCDESNIKEIATFDGNGGPNGESILKKEGEELGTLPVITRDGYEFLGWFTEKEGGTQITETTKMPSGGAIYYAQWKQNIPLCQRATTLHEETCDRTSNGCYSAGYTNDNKGTKIKYGNDPLTRTSKILESGDAFDCDVDGSGKYESDERFYYVSDYYNTSTKQFETDTAVLIYYNNVKNGEPNNTFKIARGGNANGPSSSAISHLPTNDIWPNVQLSQSTRNILAGTDKNIKDNFIYSTSVARFLTFQELVSACGKQPESWGNDGLVECEYLLENTNFIKSTYAGYFLETTLEDARHHYVVDGIQKRLFYAYYEYNYYSTSSNIIGVRPVIEVSKDDIEY